MNPDAVIEVRDVVTRYGEQVVHDGVSLDVRPGEIFALAGASGCGKSTLLREMLLLERPASGHIRVFTHDLARMDEVETVAMRQRMGVLFQHGALFSSLSVVENVAMPLREYARVSEDLIGDVAAVKVLLVGLQEPDLCKVPGELSGGMRKRVAMARAIALDPELLFLDEPTAGLDPFSAGEIDELVLQLKETFGLTVVMVTHDLDSLWRVADRVAIMGEGKVLAVGSMRQLSQLEHPAVREYFYGPRGRIVKDSKWSDG